MKCWEVLFVLTGLLLVGVYLAIENRAYKAGYAAGHAEATANKVVMAVPSPDSFRYLATFDKKDVAIYLFEDADGKFQFGCVKSDKADASYLLDADGVRVAAFK